MNLHPVIVTSSSFGKLSGVTIYITQDLYKRLDQGDGSRNPLTLANLRRGRALRGLKHLIEMIQETGEESKLVLTLGSTRRDGSNYFVNFDEYRQSAQGRFFEFYRNVGLESSLDYLSQHFPDEFEGQSQRLSEIHLDTAARNLDRYLGRKEEKREHRREANVRDDGGRPRRPSEPRLSRKQIETVENLRSQSTFLYYESVVEELRDRLAPDEGYPEVSGPDSWQQWIHRNSWLFGPMHLEPIDRQRVGFQEIPDFLFPTLDGFIDVLEIKLPEKTVINPGSNGSNAFTWSNDANRAIGQVVNYLQQMAIHQYPLSQRINRLHSKRLGSSVMVLRPRAFILIGNEAGWTEAHREGYRSLNFSLHGIEVITYDELLRRGEQMIRLYSLGEGEPS